MKSILSKCYNPQKTADLFTFAKEIISRKLHFLCSDTDGVAVIGDRDYMTKVNG